MSELAESFSTLAGNSCPCAMVSAGDRPGVIGRIELTNSIARTLGDPDVRTRRCEFVNKCKKRGHKG
jgi:hypothetical protein